MTAPAQALAQPPDRAEAVLAALDPEQRAAARAVRGPVCILAGAGTGKTRTITHRIAYAVHTGAVQPPNVLAVTFTARAAGEMRTRLRDLGVPGVAARTFHAAALRQVQYFWPRVRGGEPPRVLEHKARLVAGAARESGLRADAATVRDLAGEIEWAKVSGFGPHDYVAGATAAGRRPSVPATDVEQVLGRYGRALERAGLMDFEDMISIAAELVRSGKAREEFRRQYRCFVVDEYQDVNPAQQRLLDAWLGDRQELCVVGDPSQTIYSFAGASSVPLLSFRSRFPDATVVRLERDYRSTPQVVAAANTLIAGAPARHRLSHLTLRGQRPSGPAPILTGHADDAAEAAAVAAECRRLLAAGTAPSSIAVLYRLNAQGERLEAALGAAGVAYLVRGGERFFERAEVREAIRVIRAAARTDPGRSGALTPPAPSASVWDGGAASTASAWDGGAPPPATAGALDVAAALALGGADEARAPTPCGADAAATIGPAAEAAGRTGGTGVAFDPPGDDTAGVDTQPLGRQVEHVLSAIGWSPAPPADSGARRERWESLRAIIRLADSLDPAATLAALAEDLTERATMQHAPVVEGVTLATLHSAKGLEWDRVFVVGVVEGVLPISHADSQDAVEEERRLLYVGVTRAREHLVLSWYDAREGGRRCRPSRFLTSLGLVDGTTRDRPHDVGRPGSAAAERRSPRGQARCRVCGASFQSSADRRLGRCATCPSDADAAVFERLRTWRRDRAAALGQPAFCVFTDATLVVIAETQPADAAGLARIPGVGPSKLEKFGHEVLDLVAGRPVVRREVSTSPGG